MPTGQSCPAFSSPWCRLHNIAGLERPLLAAIAQGRGSSKNCTWMFLAKTWVRPSGAIESGGAGASGERASFPPPLECSCNLSAVCSQSAVVLLQHQGHHILMQAAHWVGLLGLCREWQGLLSIPPPQPAMLLSQPGTTAGATPASREPSRSRPQGSPSPLAPSSTANAVPRPPPSCAHGQGTAARGTVGSTAEKSRQWPCWTAGIDFVLCVGSTKLHPAIHVFNNIAT